MKILQLIVIKNKSFGRPIYYVSSTAVDYESTVFLVS